MNDADNSRDPSPLPVQESFAGGYYDGKTSARQPVSLVIVEPHVRMQGEAWFRDVLASDTRLSEPSLHVPLLLHFADGGHCELPHSPQLHDRLRSAGVPVTRMSGLASVLEGDWRLAVMSVAFLVAAIMAFYVWLLPSIAELTAPMIPRSVQARLGNTVMDQLESRWFEPSRLPTGQQADIQGRFQQLLGKQSDQYEFYIRKSRIGPNALTLPGNIIVLTDELVTLVDGNLDAVTGVLAHELGHVANHHVLRGVIQASALTIMASAIIGDYSSALAAVPATLGQLHYSRAFEAEADAYAYDLLCKQGIDPAKTALFFDKIAVGPTGDVDKLIPEYLKTHPGSSKRAELFRSGC